MQQEISLEGKSKTWLRLLDDTAKTSWDSKQDKIKWKTHTKLRRKVERNRWIMKHTHFQVIHSCPKQLDTCCWLTRWIKSVTVLRVSLDEHFWMFTLGSLRCRVVLVSEELFSQLSKLGTARAGKRDWEIEELPSEWESASEWASTKSLLWWHGQDRCEGDDHERVSS